MGRGGDVGLGGIVRGDVGEDVKERPILMTPENAQKVHVGTKTQTRRIIKPQPPEWIREFGYTCFTPKGSISGRGSYEDQGPGEKFFKCPYGVPGDRLWVRESIYIDHFDYFKGPLPKEKPDLDDGMLIYRGEGTCCEQFSECDCGGKGAPWRAAFHMPRWACRTVLEIIEIRVQRLIEISQDDAIAEGVCDTEFYDRAEHAVNAGAPMSVERLAYAYLWDSINGPGSWDANPWVWAISFRKIEP